jgi:hypothetical protein
MPRTQRHGVEKVLLAFMASVLAMTACSSTSKNPSGSVAAKDGSGSTAASGAPGSSAVPSTSAAKKAAGSAGGAATGSGSTAKAAGGTSGTTGGSGGGAATTGGVTLPRSGSGKINAALPPLRLGYVIVDLSGSASLTGSDAIGGYAQSGANDRAKKEMKALVDLANASGGVGGRKIEAQGFIISAYASNAERHAFCVQMTEDAKREVVVDPFVFLTEGDYTCFAQHKVTLVGFVTGTNSAFLRKLSPYIYTPWDSHERSAKALVSGLNDAGYFKNAKVGVAMYDEPTSVGIYNNVMLPALKKLGVTPKAIFKFSTDSSKYGSEAPNAVLKFQQAGVDHVISELGLLAYLAFSNAADSQQYHPRYGFGDFQSAAADAAFYGQSSQNTNAVAVSASYVNIANDNSTQTTDINAPYDPKKVQPGLKRCLDIMTKGTGANYYQPSSSGASFNWRYYCDTFLLWLEGARKIGANVTPQTVGRGITSLGSSYLSTFMQNEDFGSGRTDGAASYRTGVFDTSCKCFVGQGPWRPLA